MASGVGVNDEVVTKYNELQKGHKFRYVMYRLSDDLEEVILDKVGERGDSWDQFTASLPENDCRYAIYDFEFRAGDHDTDKILFVVWAPDSAKIKSKMLYASTKDAVRKKLPGIGTEIQATDQSEIAYDEVLEKCLSQTR